MDFGARGGDVFPDEFFVGIDDAGAGHAGEDDIAVGEHGGVVEFLDVAVGEVEGDGIGPDDFAFFDEEHGLVGFAGVPFAGIEEGMLCEALAGEDGGGLGGAGAGAARGSGAAAQAASAAREREARISLACR